MEMKVSATQSRASSSVSSARETLQKLKVAEDEFDTRMHKAAINERARIEAMRLFKEELSTNHGKPKTYFQVPVFSSSRRQRETSGLEVEVPKRQSLSIDRTANKRVLKKSWGSSIVTKEQVKRLAAKKVEKKLDELDLCETMSQGAPKLEPLDPKYKYLVDEHL